MMKRILVVLLLGCLLCLALAGCGKTDLDKSQEYMDNHPLAQKKLYSVSFCLVSDDAIDAVTMNAISENFNRYTEANYNIHVEFTNVTAAEYAAWLEGEFTRVEEAHAARLAAEAAAAEAAANQGSGAEGTGTGTPATEAPATEVPATSSLSTSGDAGSLGSDIRDVYPEIAADQFDIIYVADYDMLASLVRAGRLRDLTADMDSKDYRLIKKQMTEKFFESSKLAGKVFALPNCRVLADYKYLRVNVEKAVSLNFALQKEITDYSSTNMLRQKIEADGGNPASFVQRDVVGDYNYRYTLAEDGAWWVYASASEQLPQIAQTKLMEGMLAITSYAYIDNGGTVLTEEDDYCPAVRLLYAVNTQPVLQSTLRYGNYSLKTITVGDTSATVVIPQDGYAADSKYTGNVLALYPTEEEYLNNVRKGIDTQNRETRITKEIYLLSAVSATNGCTATVSTEFAKTGETVTFTATPAEGYRFTQWVVKTDDGEEQKSTDAVYEYVVVPGDIELIAQFAQDEAE